MSDQSISVLATIAKKPVDDGKFLSAEQLMEFYRGQLRVEESDPTYHWVKQCIESLDVLSHSDGASIEYGYARSMPTKSGVSVLTEFAIVAGEAALLKFEEEVSAATLEWRERHIENMFREALEEAESEPKMASERLQAIVSKLAADFPLPDSVYINGDGKWCVDWEPNGSDMGVFTCLSTADRLLVVVDVGNDRFLRLPCDIGTADCLENLRYGLSKIFR